jgi:hypothetical protein
MSKGKIDFAALPTDKVAFVLEDVETVVVPLPATARGLLLDGSLRLMIGFPGGAIAAKFARASDAVEFGRLLIRTANAVAARQAREKASARFNSEEAKGHA